MKSEKISDIAAQLNEIAFHLSQQEGRESSLRETLDAMRPTMQIPWSHHESATIEATYALRALMLQCDNLRAEIQWMQGTLDIYRRPAREATEDGPLQVAAE